MNFVQILWTDCKGKPLLACSCCPCSKSFCLYSTSCLPPLVFLTCCSHVPAFVQSTQHSLQILQGVLQSLKLMRANKRKFTILDGLSGRVTPGRMTLLLGPPGSGKSTLLMALAGKLRKSDLQACGFHRFPLLRHLSPSLIPLSQS